MTRRCSVMRIPVAAQRASMPVALSAGVDFSAVMGLAFSAACCATAGALRQVATHQKCVQLFPARLPVIAFAARCDGKSGPLVESPRRLIIFLDLEEHATHAAASEMPKMRQQQVARQATAAMTGINAQMAARLSAAGPLESWHRARADKTVGLARCPE